MLDWTFNGNLSVKYNPIAGYVIVSVFSHEITMHRHGSLFAKDYEKGAQMFYAGGDSKAEATGLGKNGARVPWNQGVVALATVFDEIRGTLAYADDTLQSAAKYEFFPELREYVLNGEHVLRHFSEGLFKRYQAQQDR